MQKITLRDLSLIATCVFFFSCSSRSTNGADEKPVLMFTLHGPTTANITSPSNGNSILDPLQRELARQGVLLIAREEFGLSTRDESLLEPIDIVSDHTFHLQTILLRNDSVTLKIENRGKEIFSRKVKLYAGWVHGYYGFATIFRTQLRSELVAMFASLGYQKRPNKKIATGKTAPLPGEVERLLMKMNHVSQLRALRMIHGAIRKNGESAERLSGLVRGYANLAQLTTLTPDTRSYVFAARSILYSSRLHRLFPNSSEDAWAYIYSSALVGFPVHSLRILGDLKKTKDKLKQPIPEWAPLVEEYCFHRFQDLQKRAKLANSEPSQLAAVLAQKSAEHSFSYSFLVRTASTMVELNPDCLWHTDSMAQRAGVASKHTITHFQPIRHSNQLQNHLADWPELPETVRNLFDTNPDYLDLEIRAEIANSLVDAGKDDRLEPSFAVLGRGVEALNVLHIITLGKFLKHSLGVDSHDEILEAEVAIRNHPLAALVRTLGLRKRAAKKAYAKLVADYEYKDSNWSTTISMLRDIPAGVSLTNMKASDAYTIGSMSVSNYEFSFINHFRQTTGKKALGQADWMKQLSPNSPLRLATYMRYDFDNHREEIEIWLEENGQHPVIVLAASRAFADQQDFETAIPLFNRYLEVVPDSNVFTELARHYFRQYDDEKWLATLERIYEHEDYALAHSVAARGIASTFMHQGDFKSALPWARKSYTSGAYHGMEALKDCLTALGKFEEAEEVAREQTLRYGMNSNDDCWYFWCLSNDQGDIESAFRLRQKRLKGILLDPKIVDTMQILTGDKIETVRDQLKSNLDIRPDSLELINLALVYDQLKQAKKRDEMFVQLIEMGKRNHGYPAHSAIAPELREYAASGKIDEDRLLAIAKDLSPRNFKRVHSAIMYYFAVMQANRGETEKAIENWKKTARMSKIATTRILAWRRLRNAGIEPALVKHREFPNRYKR